MTVLPELDMIKSVFAVDPDAAVREAIALPLSLRERHSCGRNGPDP